MSLKAGCLLVLLDGQSLVFSEWLCNLFQWLSVLLARKFLRLKLTPNVWKVSEFAIGVFSSGRTTSERHIAPEINIFNSLLFLYQVTAPTWDMGSPTGQCAESCIGLAPGADLLICAKSHFMVSPRPCSTQLSLPWFYAMSTFSWKRIIIQKEIMCY